MSEPVTVQQRIVRDGRVLFHRGETIHGDIAARLGINPDGTDGAPPPIAAGPVPGTGATVGVEVEPSVEDEA